MAPTASTTSNAENVEIAPKAPKKTFGCDGDERALFLAEVTTETIESAAKEQGVEKASIARLFQLAESERKEIARQNDCIELVASENYPHPLVLRALASPFQNKYAEGAIGRRYYAGTQNVDDIEALCKTSALELFGLDASFWDVNVQCLSGSLANLTVYTALAGPHLGRRGRLLGLALQDGGHLTHGHAASMTSQFFETRAYHVDATSALIDYDGLERTALDFSPDIIIAGISAYSRELDYERFRRIADKVGCFLVADMAHISGLLAGRALKNDPFEHCDVVTTTTHKTLRGPRAAMIFARKVHAREPKLVQKLTAAHFPGLTGGPHNNKIFALAVALNLARGEKFREYARSCVENAREFAKVMQQHGFEVLTGGTDNHMLLVKVVRANGRCDSRRLLGSHVQALADACAFSVNMNAVPGDVSALRPSGVRIGMAQLTSRGVRPAQIGRVANLFVDLIEFAESIIASFAPEVKITKELFADKISECESKCVELRANVGDFIKDFPIAM